MAIYRVRRPRCYASIGDACEEAGPNISFTAARICPFGIGYAADSGAAISGYGSGLAKRRARACAKCHGIIHNRACARADYDIIVPRRRGTSERVPTCEEIPCALNDRAMACDGVIARPSAVDSISRA